MQHYTNQDSNTLLRLQALQALTGLSKSTIYSSIKAGSFPASVKISKRAVAWKVTDIQIWLDSLQASGVRS